MKIKGSFPIIFLSLLVLFGSYMPLNGIVSAQTSPTTIQITPDRGTVGSELKVTGKNFAGTLATISLDGRVIAEKVLMKMGDFEHTISIPKATKGPHVIKVTDNSNWEGSKAEAEFNIVPGIELFPGVIESNTSFTVYGHGFEASEAHINIFVDGKNVVPERVDAGRFGSWTATVNTQDLARGRHAVSAAGSTTQSSELQELSLIMAPYAEFSPSTGPAGTQIIIYAWGFMHNEDGITVTWDGRIIKTNVEAEANGSLIIDGSPRPNPAGTKGKGDTYESAFVPPSTRGEHLVGLYGSSFTPRGTFPDHAFTIIPSLELNPDRGKKADIIQVTGMGFSKNEVVTLKYAGLEVKSDLVADESGTFKLEYVIPQVSAGDTTFHAAGNQGSTAQAVFSLQQAGTDVFPVLLQPVDGQSVSTFNSVGDVFLGIFEYLGGIGNYLSGAANRQGSDITVMRWALTGENRQLNYILQVSGTSNFSRVELERNVSGGTEYYLKRTDGLEVGRYYWRVRGIDTNGNMTDWSETAHFQIAPVQKGVIAMGWALVAMIVVAIIVIAILIKANIRKYRY